MSLENIFYVGKNKSERYVIKNTISNSYFVVEGFKPTSDNLEQLEVEIFEAIKQDTVDVYELQPPADFNGEIGKRIQL